jgi:hypothetical protein
MCIDSNPSSGYFVEYDSTASSGKYRHQFCGEHDVAGAWCPNCNKPLLRFLALDTSDFRLNLLPVRLRQLSLFYCWTCTVSNGLFLYQIRSDTDVRILQYTKGKMEFDFPGVPYDGYPPAFPEAACYLVPITADEQSELWNINSESGDLDPIAVTRDDLRTPRHQIGGEPLLVQCDSGVSPQCPVCCSPMPFFAEIGNQCLDARGLHGCEEVQVMYYLCRACCVVAAYNRVD